MSPQDLRRDPPNTSPEEPLVGLKNNSLWSRREEFSLGQEEEMGSDLATTADPAIRRV